MPACLLSDAFPIAMNDPRPNAGTTPGRAPNRSWLVMLAAAIVCAVLAVVVSRIPEKDNSPSGVDASVPVFLGEDTQASAREFIRAADALGSALASDDLAGFNSLLPGVVGALTNLDGAFTEKHPWRAAVGAVKESGQLAPALNLEFARREFGPFSKAAVDFAKLARQNEAFNGVKIYECPMAAPPGLWLQVTGAIHNPFFGHEMPHCGREVAE